jgi:hypothetical protein
VNYELKCLLFVAACFVALFRAAYTSGGATVLTLTGTNFGPANSQAVKINAASCPLLTSSHTEVTCALPSGHGTASVTLTTGQQTSLPSSFAYLGPVITGFTCSGIPPTSGLNSAGGAFIITIQGQSFGTAGDGSSISVTIGLQACPIVSQSHTVVTCQLPAGEGTQRAIKMTVDLQDAFAPVALNYGAPNITSISPVSQALTSGGSTLTVTGINFGLSSSVRVGGNNCPILTQTHTTLTCRVPSGQGAPSIVDLSAFDQSSNLFSARVYANPTLSGAISPSTLPTSGGTITIAGSNFGTFGSVSIGTFRCNPPTSASWSNTQIVCRITGGEGANLPIVIGVSGSTTTQSSAFSFQAPTISNVAPVAGSTAGGATLTLTGANFGIAPTVMVGTWACQVVSVWFDSVVCTISEGRGTSLAITITVGGVVATASATFSYSAPAIDSITPTIGSTTGGYLVTIMGSSFDSAGTVSIGGAACDISTYSHSRIVCVAPVGTGTAARVVVTAAVSGRASSSNVFFAYSAPTISGFTPSSVVTGPGTRLLTISGSNFGGPNAATITVGGIACTLNPGSNQTHSLLVCQVAIGTGVGKQIAIVVGGQTAISSGTFAYSSPILSAFSPPLLPTAGLVTLTINGSSFGDNTVVVGVKVGTASCNVATASHTQITCTAPAGVGTFLTMTVSVDGQVSNGQQINYLPPTLASVSPTTGPTAGGFPVTLVGTNFGAAGATVALNGLACTNVVQSHSQITCTMPAGEDVNGFLTVTVGSQTSNSIRFAYGAPTITSISPQQGSTQVRTTVNHAMESSSVPPGIYLVMVMVAGKSVVDSSYRAVWQSRLLAPILARTLPC